LRVKQKQKAFANLTVALVEDREFLNRPIENKSGVQSPAPPDGPGFRQLLREGFFLRPSYDAWRGRQHAEEFKSIRRDRPNAIHTLNEPYVLQSPQATPHAPPRTGAPTSVLDQVRHRRQPSFASNERGDFREEPTRSYRRLPGLAWDFGGVTFRIHGDPRLSRAHGTRHGTSGAHEASHSSSNAWIVAPCRTAASTRALVHRPRSSIAVWLRRNTRPPWAPIAWRIVITVTIQRHSRIDVQPVRQKSLLGSRARSV
jgi:hypothetical protein